MKQKIFLILIIAIASIMPVKSQQAYLNRVSVNYAFSQYAHLQNLTIINGVNHVNQSSAAISYSRMLPSNFEVGVYCDVLFAQYIKSNRELYDRTVFSPGVLVNYHLLPAMQVESELFDVYLCGNIGGTFAQGCKLEYGLGLGGQYFIFKHLGIILECGFGHYTTARLGFTTTSNFQARAGLSWRW